MMYYLDGDGIPWRKGWGAGSIQSREKN